MTRTSFVCIICLELGRFFRDFDAVGQVEDDIWAFHVRVNQFINVNNAMPEWQVLCVSRGIKPPESEVLLRRTLQNGIPSSGFRGGHLSVGTDFNLNADRALKSRHPREWRIIWNYNVPDNNLVCTPTRGRKRKQAQEKNHRVRRGTPSAQSCR